MIGDVKALQAGLETSFNNAQAGIEQAALQLLEKDPEAAKALLTEYTNQMAQSTWDAWKRLGEFLVVKYNDGVVRRMKDGKFRAQQHRPARRCHPRGIPAGFPRRVCTANGRSL